MEDLATICRDLLETNKSVTTSIIWFKSVQRLWLLTVFIMYPSSFCFNKLCHYVLVFKKNMIDRTIYYVSPMETITVDNSNYLLNEMNLIKLLILTHGVFNRFIFIFHIVVSIEGNRRNLLALFLSILSVCYIIVYITICRY